MLLSLVGFLLISKIIVQTSQYKIPVPTESLVETELKTFFSEYSKIKTLDLDVTLLTDNNPYAYDAIKWFLKTGQYKYLIASKCDDEFASSNQTKSLLAISPTIFMILQAEEILDTLDKMTTCPLWHTRSNIIFIIYTQVTNSDSWTSCRPYGRERFLISFWSSWTVQPTSFLTTDLAKKKPSTSLVA
jgi:hypothetical protein